MRSAFPKCSFPRRQRGVTVVESLVAATIGALALGLGTTSVLALALSERHATSARALVASLEFARTAAVARRVPVAVCGIDERGGDRPIREVRCGVEAQRWTHGWAVFEDANRNGRIDAGETVLYVESGPRLIVSASAVAPGAPLAAVGFRPVGALDHATPVVLTLTSGDGEVSRRICVATDGAARILAPDSPCR
ncbi:MAG: GspH/FimT family pseudopilin [Burkholderiaceae bacterium]